MRSGCARLRVAAPCLVGRLCRICAENLPTLCDCVALLPPSQHVPSLLSPCRWTTKWKNKKKNYLSERSQRFWPRWAMMKAAWTVSKKLQRDTFSSCSLRRWQASLQSTACCSRCSRFGKLLQGNVFFNRLQRQLTVTVEMQSTTDGQASEWQKRGHRCPQGNFRVK